MAIPTGEFNFNTHVRNECSLGSGAFNLSNSKILALLPDKALPYNASELRGKSSSLFSGTMFVERNPSDPYSYGYWRLSCGSLTPEKLFDIYITHIFTAPSRGKFDIKFLSALPASAPKVVMFNASGLPSVTCNLNAARTYYVGEKTIGFAIGATYSISITEA